MHRAEFRLPHICCICQLTYEHDLVDPGWTPLRRGWRCPTCSRAYTTRIDAMARTLVDNHRRCLWVATDEHTAYDECLWCDVLRRASDLILHAKPRSPAS